MLERNNEPFDKLFFSPALDEKLKHISNPDQLVAILEFLVNERFLYLDKLSISDCYAILNDRDHSKGLNTLIENTVSRDTANIHPLLSGYYSLIADNIYNLDSVKLEASIKWFKTNLQDNPHYAFVHNNLLAIHTACNRQPFEKVDLPDNSYLNLAKANLSNANLGGMSLCYINLAGANLEHADLSNSQLNGSNLKGATLNGANLQYACLQQVALDCSLRNADLTGADLRHGYLHKAGLDLTGATLCHAKMDYQTLFLGSASKSSQKEFDKYVTEKKLMLTQAEYFNPDEFTDLAKMERTFTEMHEMLKDNLQFPFIQNCISNDLINKLTKLKAGNPELADQLYNIAYNHPLFENSTLVVRAANHATRSMFSLFCYDTTNMPNMVESESQEQMRSMFGAK